MCTDKIIRKDYNIKFRSRIIKYQINIGKLMILILYSEHTMTKIRSNSFSKLEKTRMKNMVKMQIRCYLPHMFIDSL